MLLVRKFVTHLTTTAVWRVIILNNMLPYLPNMVIVVWACTCSVGSKVTLMASTSTSSLLRKRLATA